VTESITDLFSMESLYLAYRKAKVDVFHERSQPMAEAFCEYEKSLHANLSALATHLQAKNPKWPTDATFIGGFGFIPKGITLPTIPGKSSGEPHFSLSDPEEAWKYQLKRCAKEKPTVEFRPVAHFSVDMYVICALWVNLIGHMYDACLDDCVHGSRLRRLRGDANLRRPSGQYHEQAPGSFQPYFYCYREWRARGLKAIRHELNKRRRVVALTMDLTAFYHNVDPQFLLDARFLTKARFQQTNGRDLSNNERRFTSQLVKAFTTWATMVPGFDAAGPTGVPVGPSAPRIIANVLLVEFDRLVLRHLAPIYYGRYVDDIFLVLRDTGNFTSADRIVSHLTRRITPLTLNADRNELQLVFPYAAKSQLIFKTEKQRVFLLAGEIGKDLLDAIESKIDEVSSEWRLLPNLDDLERSPAARVLTAAKKSNEDADALRKADGLSLRRLGFSLLLRSINALVRDLPPTEWVSDRRRFYRFASRHVLTPLRLMDLHDYLPRLLGLAVACRDWTDARKIVARIGAAITSLRANVVVQPPTKSNEQWDGYLRHLKRSLLEAVVCSYPLDHKATMSISADRLVEDINSISPDFDDLFAQSCPERANDLFWSDLSRTPFKDVLLDKKYRPITTRTLDVSALPPGRRERAEIISHFLSKLGESIETLAPLLFPTRPLGAPEVTELCPETAENLTLLRDWVHALRGTWVGPISTGENNAKNGDVIEIGIVRKKRRPNRADKLLD